MHELVSSSGVRAAHKRWCAEKSTLRRKTYQADRSVAPLIVKMLHAFYTSITHSARSASVLTSSLLRFRSFFTVTLGTTYDFAPAPCTNRHLLDDPSH